MLAGSVIVLPVALPTVPMFSVRLAPPPSVRIVSPSFRALLRIGPPTTSKTLPTTDARYAKSIVSECTTLPAVWSVALRVKRLVRIELSWMRPNVGAPVDQIVVLFSNTKPALSPNVYGPCCHTLPVCSMSVFATTKSVLPVRYIWRAVPTRMRAFLTNTRVLSFRITLSPPSAAFVNVRSLTPARSTPSAASG